jgi:hypothetical protein
MVLCLAWARVESELRVDVSALEALCGSGADPARGGATLCEPTSCTVVLTHTRTAAATEPVASDAGGVVDRVADVRMGHVRSRLGVSDLALGCKILASFGASADSPLRIAPAAVSAAAASTPAAVEPTAAAGARGPVKAAITRTRAAFVCPRIEAVVSDDVGAPSAPPAPLLALGLGGLRGSLDDRAPPDAALAAAPTTPADSAGTDADEDESGGSDVVARSSRMWAPDVPFRLLRATFAVRDMWAEDLHVADPASPFRRVLASAAPMTTHDGAGNAGDVLLLEFQKNASGTT